MGGIAQFVSLFGTNAVWVLHAEEVERVRSASWSWDLAYTLPLAAMALFYLLGFYRMKGRLSRDSLQWIPLAMFTAGWLSLVIALNSPIHEIGERLFWVHMTQHEILVLISAPLLVLSRPLAPMLWALPLRWREELGEVPKIGFVRNTWMLLSAPVVAWTLHAVALWAWHVPALFDATLHSSLVHAMQHISFLGTALLFWWALLQGHHGRLGHGAAVLYVFTTAIHTSILGALLTFASHTWYPSYAQTAPALGWSALQDQQIGGLIMWVPSGTVLTIVALWMVMRALKSSDRRWEYSRTAALLRETVGGAHEM